MAAPLNPVYAHSIRTVPDPLSPEHQVIVAYHRADSEIDFPEVPVHTPQVNPGRLCEPPPASVFSKPTFIQQEFIYLPLIHHSPFSETRRFDIRADENIILRTGNPGNHKFMLSSTITAPWISFESMLSKSIDTLGGLFCPHPLTKINASDYGYTRSHNSIADTRKAVKESQGAIAAMMAHVCFLKGCLVDKGEEWQGVLSQVTDQDWVHFLVQSRAMNEPYGRLGGFLRPYESREDSIPFSFSVLKAFGTPFWLPFGPVHLAVDVLRRCCCRPSRALDSAQIGLSSTQGSTTFPVQGVLSASSDPSHIPTSHSIPLIPGAKSGTSRVFDDFKDTLMYHYGVVNEDSLPLSGHPLTQVPLTFGKPEGINEEVSLVAAHLNHPGRQVYHRDLHLAGGDQCSRRAIRCRISCPYRNHDKACPGWSVFFHNELGSQFPWILAIHDPATALHVFRRWRNLPTETIVTNISARGMSFSLHLLRTPPCSQPPSAVTRASISHPILEQGISPGPNEYRSYMAKVKDLFLAHPSLLQAALQLGGLIWRIACDAMGEGDIPCICGPGEHSLVVGVDRQTWDDGTEVWQDILTHNEILFILGHYFQKTNHGNSNLKEISWWPKLSTWNSCGLYVNLWTPLCEEWYQARVQKLTKGEGTCLPQSKWRSNLRYHDDTQQSHLVRHSHKCEEAVPCVGICPLGHIRGRVFWEHDVWGAEILPHGVRYCISDQHHNSPTTGLARTLGNSTETMVGIAVGDDRTALVVWPQPELSTEGYGLWESRLYWVVWAGVLP
ncbi:hypothetical protein BXZ70DRAFT_908245 [Cristinia sonorae]|uniref:Uncharacterized protein n=1 Tax=Cristinia sonorae TaxID=1940300 RepID=A0A8K0ULV3_9AGAR|nr:hypothetical protein BXZ70DRAFT_908245 [Cristinia sonorae]